MCAPVTQCAASAAFEPAMEGVRLCLSDRMVKWRRSVSLRLGIASVAALLAWAPSVCSVCVCVLLTCAHVHGGSAMERSHSCLLLRVHARHTLQCCATNRGEHGGGCKGRDEWRDGGRRSSSSHQRTTARAGKKAGIRAVN